MNACSKSFTPLVNSRVDNVLVKTAPDMNQPLLQLINTLQCLCGKHAPKSSFHPYLMVNWVEV